jgi:hypothetical protein
VSNEIVQDMLEAAPDGGFRLERLERSTFDDLTLTPLYELANTLMRESYAHFALHARTNDELYVFRRKRTNELVGFQFWRVIPGRSATERFVLGGKLRVRAEARRHGLHLAAGLLVLLEQAHRFPSAQISRLSIASLFGFVSITRRLSHYAFVDAAASPEWIDAIDQVARDSHYRFDARSGQVEVGIHMTPAQLEGYPAAFFDSAAARAYIARNPDFRSNGRYLAFGFTLDRQNLTALARGAAESALGADPRAGVLAERLIAESGLG